MKGLDRFEAFAEQLLESSLGRWMGGRLEPIELAKRLARVMDDHQTVGAGKVFVPNHYTVRLNPANYGEFESFRGALEEELANYLSEVAERRQFSFVGRPHVRLEADPAVKAGEARVVAELLDGQGVAVSGPGMTQELQVAQVQAAAAAYSGSAQVAWLSDNMREVPLRTARLTIGRALDNDLILEGTGVSRRHAQIEQRHGRYVLRDLGSRHGTQVNGQPVQEVVLRDGDVLSLGGQRLVFRMAPAPTSDAPTAPAAGSSRKP